MILTPGDLYVADLMDATSAVDHLTKPLAAATVQDVDAYPINADGLEVDGFFVRPVGWHEAKYPMLLNIHGARRACTR